MPSNPIKSWSGTLRLPKSTFPPRAALADQAKYLKRCTDDLYEWQAGNRGDAKPFVLHDGPPYANGELHAGHALNKILKDMICRAELHQGRKVQFVPGWDCHGLPIEIKALEAYRAKQPDGGRLDAVGIRNAARNLAFKTVKEQKKTFREWAIMADWDNAWTTMDKGFEMKQLAVFQDMVKKGLIFRRFKPVYWSPSSKTALAEAELEYKEDHESTAAYVAFPVERSSLSSLRDDLGAFHAVVWTTTPWTLPANLAIAVNEELKYAIIEAVIQPANYKRQFLVAESRMEHFANTCGIKDSFEVIESGIPGSKLIGAVYDNPLREKPGQLNTSASIISADFVSAESGTGLVHLAPGHGMDDYEVCMKQGISAFAPVNDEGLFTNEALPADPEVLAGASVLKDGSGKVLKLLAEKVLAVHKYKHKYPYDWRTKEPVIVRATEQWFADVGSIKDEVLNSLKAVKFIPESGRPRLESFVKGRSEWCISRQRAWGVPIPALYNEDGKAVLTDESVAHIVSVIRERGIDSWWTDAEDNVSWVAPGLQGSYRRGKDTMDVWFDSGSSWTQTATQADIYLEGTDQHRGWFQSSLLTHAVASGRGVPPFKTLITHGFTLDHEGKKMSKSIGNVIAPSQITDGSLLPPVKRKGQAAGTVSYDGLGPDALRLWVASSDYTRDVVIGQPVLKSVNNSLIKYRTTLKMLLGSIHSHPSELPLTKLDRIALYQLESTMRQVVEAWKTHEFHKAVAIINRWVTVDLSSFYLEAIKDRVYCGDGGGVLYYAFQGLLQMLSPITPLLVEEAWSHRPQWMKDCADEISPLKRTFNVENPLSLPTRELATGVADDIPWLMNANTAIKTAQEEARRGKLIGSSLESSVVILLPFPGPADQGSQMTVFERYKDELEALFVVSSVEINGAIEDDAEWQFSVEFDAPGGGKGRVVVLPPKAEKCGRCWRFVAEEEGSLCKRCEDVVKI